MAATISIFKVIIPNKVTKQISKLPKEYQRAVYESLKSLVENPQLGKKLEDKLQNNYSLRVGVYRIIYEIFKKELIILIVSVGHRKEVYKRR